MIESGVWVHSIFMSRLINREFDALHKSPGEAEIKLTGQVNPPLE